MKKFIRVACILLVTASQSAAMAITRSFLTPWDGVLDRTFSVTASEWWYTIGFLSGVNQSGRKRHFGFMVNVVRGADLYTSPVFQVYPAVSLQLSLLDLDNRTHFTAQIKTQGPDLTTFGVLTGPHGGQFATRGNSSSTGTLLSRFKVGGNDFAMDLIQAPLKSQAEFGNKGIVDNNSLGKAVYVSRTRQQIQPGSAVRLKNESISVTGLSWEDHQLTGMALGKPVKWNWFAILLKDGSEVMAYKIEDARSGELLKNYAGHVLQNGQVENLDGSFSVTETDHAHFAGLNVPTAWNISLPSLFSAGIRHIVPLPSVPVTAGQITGTYFEGPCAVQKDQGPTKIQAVWAEYFNGGLFK